MTPFKPLLANLILMVKLASCLLLAGFDFCLNLSLCKLELLILLARLRVVPLGSNLFLLSLLPALKHPSYTA